MSSACRDALARAWAEAVTGTSYVPMGMGELVEYLRGLTDRLADALLVPTFDPAVAQRIGVDLISAHFTSPESLSRTIAVLGELLPGLVGDQVGDAAARISRLTGSLAAGYAGALRERTLEEQEAISRAMLVARRAAEQKLAASEARFRAMFTEAAIGIGIGDLDGNILHANRSLLQMFGYSAEEFRRRNVVEMVHPEDAAGIWQNYEQLVHGERDYFRAEKRFFQASGEVIWTHLTVSLVRDEAGAPAYQVAMLEDVSERQRLQSRLEHQAFHDSLTRLPNRALFSERLARVFAQPAGERRIGLCYLDLDGFKAVNDSLGHDVGDQLLVAVAARLARCCGSGQLVARMGGDEFVILIEDSAGLDEVITLAEEILAALAPPMQIGIHQLVVSASIGIIEQPVAEAGAAELMQAADITQYWAKKDGKGRYAVFDPRRNAGEIARFTLSATMPAAVDRDEFHVDYQPLVDLADGTLRGVEALVRWRHPTYGLLGPDRFIGLAEETGVIVPLGRWVLARACEQARHWRDDFGDATPFVSVNLAPRQLHERGLVADVADILADTGLEPAALQLELTERAVMSDEGGPLKALTELHDMGVRIVIDDFGTGYSNLAYLRRLPVHGLKLDRSFAQGLRPGEDADPTDERIVATLITLAHALALTVTAEGVEIAAQVERLRALCCDFGQGWFFAPPGPPEQIAAILRATTPLGTVG